MVDRALVFDKIRNILVDLFELDPSDIKPESHLYEDLDIDSIDAVDLIVHLKEETGKKVDPEAFKKIRTVDDMVDAVSELLAS